MQRTHLRAEALAGTDALNARTVDPAPLAVRQAELRSLETARQQDADHRHRLAWKHYRQRRRWLLLFRGIHLGSKGIAGSLLLGGPLLMLGGVFFRQLLGQVPDASRWIAGRMDGWAVSGMAAFVAGVCAWHGAEALRNAIRRWTVEALPQPEPP